MKLKVKYKMSQASNIPPSYQGNQTAWSSSYVAKQCHAMISMRTEVLKQRLTCS